METPRKMNRREIIQAAATILVERRDLNSELNATGRAVVVVPVLPDTATHWLTDPPKPDDVFTKATVTFTIEDGVLGRRVLAEYEGVQEFVA